MTHAAFVALVREMRRHQAAFFKSRDKRDLNRAIEYELKVDQAIREHEAAQESLFKEEA